MSHTSTPPCWRRSALSLHCFCSYFYITGVLFPLLGGLQVKSSTCRSDPPGSGQNNTPSQHSECWLCRCLSTCFNRYSVQVIQSDSCTAAIQFIHSRGSVFNFPVRWTEIGYLSTYLLSMCQLVCGSDWNVPAFCQVVLHRHSCFPEDNDDRLAFGQVQPAGLNFWFCVSTTHGRPPSGWTAVANVVITKVSSVLA